MQFPRQRSRSGFTSLQRGPSAGISKKAFQVILPYAVRVDITSGIQLSTLSLKHGLPTSPPRALASHNNIYSRRENGAPNTPRKGMPCESNQYGG